MQSLFAKSHAINFQKWGSSCHGTKPNNERGDGVDDGSLVCNTTCCKWSHHCKNLRRHGWLLPLKKWCWNSLQSLLWQPNRPHNRSQRHSQKRGLTHHNHHNESLQWRLSVAREASVLRKPRPARELTRTRKAKLKSFKTSQWRPSAKAFAETPSMWETDGVTTTSINDLTIHVINSGNERNRRSDLAFPFLPPAHAISASCALLQAWPALSLFLLWQWIFSKTYCIELHEHLVHVHLGISERKSLSLSHFLSGSKSYIRGYFSVTVAEPQKSLFSNFRVAFNSSGFRAKPFSILQESKQPCARQSRKMKSENGLPPRSSFACLSLKTLSALIMDIHAFLLN